MEGIENNNFEFKIEPVEIDGEKYENSNLFKIQYAETIKLIKKIVEDENLEHYEKNNIIAFIGDRGSGKTSSLLSTKNYVRQVYNKQNKEHKIFVIDQIVDPSNFTNISNIMHLFMSCLFKEYLIMKYENETRSNCGYDKLSEKFAKMQEILNFEGKKSFEENDPYSSLIECSDYTNVKMELKKLISDFLDFVNNCNEHKEGNGQSTYNFGKYTEVALFIDDIDLNSKHCFEMIEQIRRNMKINKLMIFLAFKWETFKNVILKNYYYDYEVLLKYNADENLPLKLEEMARHYMVKFIPMNYRVYLPSVIKIIDYLKSLFRKLFKNFYWSIFDNSNYYILFFGKNLREINQRAFLISNIISIDEKSEKLVALENYVKVVYNRNLKSISSIKFKDIIFYSDDETNEEVIINIFSIIRYIPSREDYDKYASTWKNILGDKVYFVKNKKIKKFISFLKIKIKNEVMINAMNVFFKEIEKEENNFIFELPYLLYGIDSLSLSIIVNEINKYLIGEEFVYKNFIEIFKNYFNLTIDDPYSRFVIKRCNNNDNFYVIRRYLIKILLTIDMSAKEFKEYFIQNNKEITTKQIDKKYSDMEDFIADVVKNHKFVNPKTYNELVKSNLYKNTFSDDKKEAISKKIKNGMDLIKIMEIIEEFLKGQK